MHVQTFFTLKSFPFIGEEPLRTDCACCCPERSTSAVPEIHVSRWVVFAQALQDLLVVDEAMQRPQDEDIQRDVADLLQLKVPAEVLQARARPARLLQLQQSF